LKLKVLPSEYLDSTKNGYFNGENYLSQGIEYDSSGTRVAYWLYPCFPSSDFSMKSTSVRVPSHEIIHVFRSDRAGQERGLSWLAPVMLEFKTLDNYQSAELKRREVSSCFAGFITDLDQDSLSKFGKDEQYENERITPGMLKYLPAGKSISFSNPQGDATYDPFVKAVLRKIAVGLGLSYEVLSSDLSNVNYSSGRMGFLEFQRNIDQWRWTFFIPTLCSTVSQWFLDIAYLSGSMESQNTRSTASFTPPVREMIDPTKEYAAMTEAIRAGLKSYPEALRELGFNPTKVLDEIQNFNSLLDARKIYLDCDPRHMNKQGMLQNDTGA